MNTLTERLNDMTAEELVRELDTLYPERIPHISWSDREIWCYVGARELVKSLLVRFGLDNQTGGE